MPDPPSEDAFRRARNQLVDRLADRESLSESTLDAMRSVPRHAFIASADPDRAYADRPLPIGEGQTISAPHMVAIMVDRLDLSPGERVLEIGTGCGYHAAVTASVIGSGTLYSVEYHGELAESAKDTLAELGYEVHVRHGDGREGWPDHAPYDAAYLTCAASSIPPAVVEQTRPGGRVLAPIGRGRQRLVEARIGSEGIDSRTNHGGVRFVQMQGG